MTGLGIEHGVDLDAMVATSTWMAAQLGRPSPSAVVRALGGPARRGSPVTNGRPGRSSAATFHWTTPLGHNQRHEPRRPPAHRRPEDRTTTCRTGCGSTSPRWAATGSPSRRRAGRSDMFHFRAALDLLDQDWGGRPGHAKGAWDAMVRRVDRAQDNVVISHEILAGAKPDKIAKALNDLAGNEVHIVYSARDLGRQLPAAWQESIKQGRKWPFRRFLDRYESGTSFFFRQAFDLPAVLGAWGAKLPPERLHVVTVPHDRGPNGDELWLRFCRVPDRPGVGAARLRARQPVAGDRGDLAAAQAQPAPRAGRVARPRLRRPHPRAARPGGAGRPRRRSRPPPTPPLRLRRAGGRGLDRLDQEQRVDVVGDVDDLRPRRPAEDEKWKDPDRVRAKLELGAALDALSEMTQEAANRASTDTVAGRLRAPRVGCGTGDRPRAPPDRRHRCTAGSPTSGPGARRRGWSGPTPAPATSRRAARCPGPSSSSSCAASTSPGRRVRGPVATTTASALDSRTGCSPRPPPVAARPTSP